jgi:hypothetical protein
MAVTRTIKVRKLYDDAGGKLQMHIVTQKTKEQVLASECPSSTVRTSTQTSSAAAPTCAVLARTTNPSSRTQRVRQ